MTTDLDRRTLIGSLAIGATGLALAPSVLTAAQPPLSFVVIGDWGRGTEAQHRVAAEMGRAASRVDARFVLAVGDNFYEQGVESVDDPLWQSVFEDVYTHPALQVPWHVALGNHDYYGNPQAQVDYTARSPRWRMPERYFKVTDTNLDRADVDMFVVDTAPFIESYRKDPTSRKGRNTASQDVDAQLTWLDTQLGAARRKWKLVVGHHTIHSGGSQHGDTPELVARLKPVLLRHGVQAYIAGHDHDLQHIARDGLQIVQCGGGMEARPVKAIEGTKFCIAQPGFGVMRVDGDTLTVEFRDQAGVTLYRTDISSRSAREDPVA
jgi:tartrate-resistant acid phosphatase type 5